MDLNKHLENSFVPYAQQQHYFSVTQPPLYEKKVIKIEKGKKQKNRDEENINQQ